MSGDSFSFKLIIVHFRLKSDKLTIGTQKQFATGQRVGNLNQQKLTVIRRKSISHHEIIPSRKPNFNVYVTRRRTSWAVTSTELPFHQQVCS